MPDFTPVSLRRAWATAWNACARWKSLDNERDLLDDADTRPGFVHVDLPDGRVVHAMFTMAWDTFSYRTVTKDLSGKLVATEFANGSTPDLIHRRLHHAIFSLTPESDTFKGVVISTEPATLAPTEAAQYAFPSSDATYYANLLAAFFWDEWMQGDTRDLWDTRQIVDPAVSG